MEKKNQKRRKYLKTYARLSGLVFQMAAVIGFSAFGGVWLDEKYNTDKLFTVIFSLIGVFAALYIAYKEVKSLSD
ncbi:MAG: AtpZ/AtpI family protein [Bacteroidota bacterium]